MAKLLSHYKKINKVCENCSVIFPVFPYRKNARFCSNKCRGSMLLGKDPPNAIKIGQRLSPETEFKGNSSSYEAIHQWVKRKYGKANKCEKCGTENKVRFEWSNKDGLYKKDINTWQQLCQSCHRNYDNANKIFKRTYIRLSLKYK